MLVVVWMLVRICILKPPGLEGQHFRSFFLGLYNLIRWVFDILWLFIKAIWFLVKYLVIKPVLYLLRVLYRAVKFFLIKK
jgi:hypothetical protein